VCRSRSGFLETSNRVTPGRTPKWRGFHSQAVNGSNAKPLVGEKKHNADEVGSELNELGI